jgi:hypothetical protein
MHKLKELIKQSWELHVKLSWLKEIDRAYNRYKKNSEKAAKERYVMNALIDGYNKIYNDHLPHK